MLIYMDTAISAAKGKAWHQARQFRNSDQCANGTIECTGNYLNLLTHPNIPNNNISIVTCEILI